MSFPKFIDMTKNIPFFPILHVFAPLNDVRAYIALSWKTTLITWIFYEDDIQLQIQVGPPEFATSRSEWKVNDISYTLWQTDRYNIWLTSLNKQRYY